MNFELIKIDNFYLFTCPHCLTDILVNINELNCKIFRHAIYKTNFEQVNPHLCQKDCEFLLSNDLVYGCCKPIEIITKDDKQYAIICNYK